jgi:hypothetical protein
MNPARRTSLTLSAALLLGVTLGLAGPRVKKPATEASTPPAAVSDTAAPDAGPASSRDGAASSSVRAAAASKPDAYAAAWELLQQRDLRRSERQELESSLLEEWRKIDLRAALHAAAAREANHDQDPFKWSPFLECLEEVPHQPDLVWELVSSREYGLHTRDLRRAWIRSWEESQALQLIRRLPDLPAEDRAEAIQMAVLYTHRQDEPAPGKDEVVAAVLALRGTPDEAAAMKGFAIGLTQVTETSKLGTLLLDPPDPELRDYYLAAYAMAFEGGEPVGAKPHIDSLPPGLRAEVEAAVKALRGK